MKISYDKKQDAVYIEFAKGVYDSSKKVSGFVIVDETKKGKVLGIEILDASKTIQNFDEGQISGQST